MAKKGYLYGNPDEETTQEETEKEKATRRRSMEGPAQRQERERTMEEMPMHPPSDEKPTPRPPTRDRVSQERGFLLDPEMHPELQRVRAGDRVTIEATARIDLAPPGGGRKIAFIVDSINIGSAAPALKE